MSDVRATLAEALRKAMFEDPEWGMVFNPDRLADAVLAAPGVTTIALPEPTSTREDDEDDESAHRLGWWQNGSPYYITQWGYPNEVQIAYDGEALEPIDVNEARFLAAALLAAADAAEAATDA
jgi:hypothetical protein